MTGSRCRILTIVCAGLLVFNSDRLVSADSPKPTTASEKSDSGRTPELRALAFLSREVQKWSIENKCFSCHNNGDAARVLYRARRLGYSISQKVIDDTSEWLQHPGRWKHNGGEGEFSDKKLANIQFTVTLAEAVKSGLVKDKAALLRATEMVASAQEQDGSWKIDTQETIGSPATYGEVLATVLVRRVLRDADEKRFSKQISRSEKWLRGLQPQSVLDCAALLSAIGEDAKSWREVQRRHCLRVIREGQDRTGGWGPRILSPPEPFDTAIVLLALSGLDASPELETMIANGRNSLIASQIDDGSWPETTRPPNFESYAQRISTTAWATLALLATAEITKGKQP